MSTVGELALLLDQMRDTSGDEEADHANGDTLLCAALLLLASTPEEKRLAAAIVEAFAAMEKWYA